MRGALFGGLQFEPMTYQVIGAAIAVHRALGAGYLEATYHRAFRVALRHRGIRFESDYEIALHFEGELVSRFRIDLLINGEIVVELKSVQRLEPVHFAQVRSYLRATRRRIGLLMNFNSPTLAVHRIVLDT